MAWGRGTDGDRWEQMGSVREGTYGIAVVGWGVAVAEGLAASALTNAPGSCGERQSINWESERVRACADRGNSPATWGSTVDMSM